MPTGSHLKTKEHREKISKSMKGKVNPGLSAYLKRRWQTPEYREKMSKQLSLAMTRPEVRAKRTKARKGKPNPKNATIQKELWQNPEYRAKLIRILTLSNLRKPNQPEQALTTLFVKNNLPYKYCGDGQVILGGLCPDFINTNGKKQLIELFGEYWHPIFDVAKRTAHFQQYGFSTLIIWDSELKNEAKLLKKVKKFEKLGIRKAD